MSCKIRNWKVSYFQDDTSRWVYGQLTCSPFAVSFCQQKAETFHEHDSKSDSDSAKESEVGSCQTQTLPDLQIQYADIKHVIKAKSMLVFPAIKVELHGGAIHWFSSLPDRHSVYNALDYFARHNLLDSREGEKVKLDPRAKTHRGQQLLRTVEDSEHTLAAAAADLHGQGRQLDGAHVHLQELHEDLDVADRLLSGLNTYLGRWSLPEQYLHEEPVCISKDDIPSDQDLEVLCSELSRTQLQPQLLGTLRITERALTLLTPRQRLLHSFPWMELSRVFVVSPWEMVLTKHVAGRADVSVSVVSAALLPVMRLLERRVPHLMDYQPPPASLDVQLSVKDGNAGDGSSMEKGKTRTGPSSRHTEDSLFRHTKLFKDNARSSGELSLPGAGQQQRQGKELEEEVSEAELLALRSKLGGLKSMACAVEEELISQNKALDDMIYSVDHANSRVQEATQRTNKLL